jgi:hypothetical protein
MNVIDRKGRIKFMLSKIRSLKDADIFVNDRIRSDGTFIYYLGEEITISDGEYNAIWQIIGVDTELGKGDTPLIKHHISLVPKTFIDISMIHSDNINCQGYVNSDMHRYVLPAIVARLESVLGEHLLERRVKLSNEAGCVLGVRSAMASDNGYYTTKANLLCQQQVFGTVNSSYGNEYDTGDDTEQLPGFKYGEVDKGVYNRYWLRDVFGYIGSYYRFSSVNTYGSLSSDFVNDSTCGVRPLITIG